jgi:hypothetical protein
MGFYGDLMGFYGDLMGFYGDLMGLIGFYGDLMGFNGNLIVNGLVFFGKIYWLKPHDLHGKIDSFRLRISLQAIH